MYVVTPREMREIDNRAIKEFGLPGMILMENAAIRTVDVIEREYSEFLKEGKVTVLVGGGNNGGDGLAIARHLLLRGVGIEVFLFAKEDALSGDAKDNLLIYKRLGGNTQLVICGIGLEHFNQSINQSNLIIDGIFGTGITRNIQGIIFRAIEGVNKTRIPVIAVDIPSGINGRDGQIMGTAIKADHTVSFGYAKRGHMLYPGKEYTGNLHIEPISLPQRSAESMGVKAFTLVDGEISLNLKKRPRDGHKGTFGKVAVIAGSAGMTGAAYLTSMAALKGGAGLVTLGCPASLNHVFQSKMTEVMTYPLPDEGQGYLRTKGIPAIRDLLTGKDVLAIGPGLDLKSDGLAILRHILSEYDISIIMDADALNHVAKDKKLLAGYRGNIVITPHPGEMARLTGKKVEEIILSPMETALDFAKEFGVIVLLKGAASIAAHPDGRIYINPTGNPGMGTGGSGDILTGLVAALAAQGYCPYDAAVYGCYIHGKAGDYAKAKLGEIGMIAGDILGMVPLVYRDLYHFSD